MKKLLYIFLLFISMQSLAQFTMFQKTYNYIGGDDFGFDVILTNDGGYAIGGNVSFDDFYLIKTNSLGDTLWTRAYGGPWLESCYALLQCSDSGYILSGIANGFAGDFYLIRTNLTGDTLWTKTYGGTNSDSPGHSITQTNDEGFYIGGSTKSTGVGDWDFCAIKTDLNGDILWTKIYGGIVEDSFGNSVKCSDGGYILAGGTKSFGMGDYDILIIKTDSSGNVLWTKTYGGAFEDGSKSIIQTNDGGYLIGGVTKSFSIGEYDSFLLKMDSLGNTQWTKTYGESMDYQCSNILLTSDSGYAMVGVRGILSSNNRDVLLLKTNSSGNLQWGKTYNGSNDTDVGYSVKQCIDGGYIISGNTYNSMTSNDVYLIKTDPSGNSGCNETNITPIVNVVSFTTTTPAIITSSGGIIVGHTDIVIDSGGTINTLCFTNGIEEANINKNDILIYPNPTSYIINMKFISESDYAIQLIDLSGRILLNKKIIKSNSIEENTIDVSLLQNGIYYLRVQNNKTSITKKIIKID